MVEPASPGLGVLSSGGGSSTFLALADLPLPFLLDFALPFPFADEERSFFDAEPCLEF